MHLYVYREQDRVVPEGGWNGGVFLEPTDGFATPTRDLDLPYAD